MPVLKCRICDYCPCLCGSKQYGTAQENKKKNDKDLWKERGEYIGKYCSQIPPDKLERKRLHQKRK